jgi:endo-1,4-beta-xylanase
MMKQNLFFKKGMQILSISALILLLVTSCSKEDTDYQPEINWRDQSFFQSDQFKSTGTDHGYFWQCYVSGGSGSISFPQAETNPGNFAATWSNVGDIIAGKGWNPGSSTRVINYNYSTLTSGFNFFGVYGWTTNPLVEYYICERGSINYNATYVGQIVSDGHAYGLYKRKMVSQLSIIGTATYWQYMSQWGNSSIASNHTVTIANHFNAWKSKMGSMGTNNFQILAVEAIGNKSGYCEANVW